MKILLILDQNTTQIFDIVEFRLFQVRNPFVLVVLMTICNNNIYTNEKMPFHLFFIFFCEFHFPQ